MLSTDLDVRDLSKILKALADETRIRIVALLAHGELCVCHLEEALELSQPNISRHLGILRASGVVVTRRDGNWIYYRLADQANTDCEKIIATIQENFASRTGLRRDVQKLLKSCGPGACC